MKKVLVSAFLLTIVFLPGVADAVCWECSDQVEATCRQISWWGDYDQGFTSCAHRPRCLLGNCFTECRVYGVTCTFWDVIPY
jgi:hypothetical protein